MVLLHLWQLMMIFLKYGNGNCWSAISVFFSSGFFVLVHVCEFFGSALWCCFRGTSVHGWTFSIHCVVCLGGFTALLLILLLAMFWLLLGWVVTYFLYGLWSDDIVNLICDDMLSWIRWDGGKMNYLVDDFSNLTNEISLVLMRTKAGLCVHEFLKLLFIWVMLVGIS